MEGFANIYYVFLGLGIIGLLIGGVQIPIEAKEDGENFVASSNNIQEKIFNLSRESILPLVTEIGTIPEFISYDSTAEKLYAWKRKWSLR